MEKNKTISLLLISCAIFIVFHILPLYKNITWNTILPQPNATQILPGWLNESQKAYLSYKQNKISEAEAIRGAGLTGNNQYLFNLGTMLAQRSFLSGQLVDRIQLQQAEQYLSGAADLGVNTEIEHNLTVVRKLLEESGSGSESQQSQNSTGENQQEQNGSGGSQQNEQQGGSSALSPELQQQIEQYKQQLEQEQQANQQFFGKQLPSNSEGFGFLDQLFGEAPELKQEINNGGEQDW